MPSVVDENSVSFAGGPVTQVGDADAGGGCTLAALEAANGDLSLFMGTDGSPIYNYDNEECTLKDYLGDAAIYKLGGFANVTDGTLAYVFAVNGIGVGRYIIVSHSDDQIVLNTTFTDPDESDVSCVVGGAFDTLQNMINKTDEGDNADRRLVCFIPSTDVSGGSVVINIGGSYIDNHHVLIEMAQASVGDMLPGEAFGGSANDAFHKNNNRSERMFNSNAAWGELDCGNAAVDAITTNGRNNVQLRSFKISNIKSGRYGTLGSGNNRNFLLFNCQFLGATNGHLGVGGAFADLWVDECYVGDNAKTGIDQAGNNLCVSNCVMEIKKESSCFGIDNNASYNLHSVTNCLIIGGMSGIATLGGGNTHIVSCTFYDQIFECVVLFAQGSFPQLTVNAYNNIFNPAEAGDYAIIVRDRGLGSPNVNGNLRYCDYNLSFAISGPGALTKPYYDDFYDAVPITVGSHNLEFRPPFKNPAGGDFSIIGDLLWSGKPGPDGSRTCVGYVAPQYGKPLLRGRPIRYQQYTHGYNP